MISRMSRFWADKFIRISGGLALLLLLAAEQKVCPSLMTPPSGATSPGSARELDDPAATRLPAGPAEPAPTDGEQSSRKRPPLSLTSVLPDAVPARRVGPLSRAALEETFGRRYVTVARGPLNASEGAGVEWLPASTPAPPWRPESEPPPILAADRPSAAVCSIRDPALETTLLRTGPPRS